MTAPAGGSGASDLHQSIQQAAQLQTVLQSLFGSFGINLSSLETDPGEDTGQYFELDPAEVREDMKLLHKVNEKAKDLFARYEYIGTQTMAPASDGPSQKQAEATRHTVKAAQNQLKSILKYSASYYDKLARSIHDYDAVEHENSADLTNAGGTPSGTAV